MPSKFSIAHEIRTSRWGRRLRPRSVNEYSTLGGTAGYNFLEMRPSSVSVLSVAVSIFFWEMSGMRRYMSLNRNVPCCSRVYRTNIAHLLPMRVSMLRMGHLGKVASWIVYLSIICVFLCKSNINSRRIGRFWRDTTDNSISKYYLQSACARASTPSAPGRVGYAALSCAANVAASGWDSRSSRTLVR